MPIIRKAITTERLIAGKQYSVEEIAKQLKLGVSRTPVREALVRLADTGLVRFERNRGVRIVKPNVRDMEELFQLRLMVEVPAAYRAAKRADEALTYKLEVQLAAMGQAVKASEELAGSGAVDGLDEQLEQINRDFVEHDTVFHELVLSAAANLRLVDTVRTWRELITALGGWRLTQSRALGIVLKEHEPVLEALKLKAPVAAAQAMYDHLKETGTLLMKELQGAVPDGGSFDPHWYEGVAVASAPARQ